MRTPVRLAVGITSAIVLGTLAATVTSAYASPQTPAPIAAPAASVVDAPVLSPSSIDGVPTLPSDDNPLLTPDPVGQVRVVEPDLTDTYAAIAAGEPIPDPPVPADVLAAAAAIDASGDSPETPGMMADAAAAATGTDTPSPDDPCAEPGADPATCPDGVESRIFADTLPEPFQMWIVPGATASHEGTIAWCDGAAPAAGQLWLDVATNLPATINVRYWPAADPSAARDLEISGVPSEEAAWQAEIDATGTYTRNAYVFQHCSLLTDLLPNTDYVVSAYGIDTYLRISDPEEATFSSAGLPTRPTMFGIPLGQSLLYVGVPYAPGDGEPTVVAGTYATGAEPPTCGSSAFIANLVWVMEPNSIDINADYLRTHHYMSAFSKRSVGILDVPEGTNVVVCALWYSRSAASFDRGTPIRYETLLASAPDTATPVFSINTIRTVKHVAQSSLTITGSTLFGNTCGTWQGPEIGYDAFQTINVNQQLCDRGGRWGGGSTNAFVVSTSYLDPHGERINSRGVIGLPSVLCTGGDCPLPADQTYDIGLPAVTVGTGLCGSSFGSDCTPPTTEVSLGVARIAVHWVRGASNGNTDWVVGTGVEVTPTSTPPDSPQFDVDQRWTATLNSTGLIGSATLAMRIDRPVNYTINVSGDCWRGTPPAPIIGRVSAPSGAYFTGTATVTGLCPGSTYASTVDLVDDAGHRTLVSPTTPSASIEPTAFQHWGSAFVVPQARLQITARTEVLHGYPWTNEWGIFGVDLTVGDARYPTNAHFDETCHSADENNIPATFPSQTIPLTDTIQLAIGSRFAIQAGYTGRAPRSECGWESIINFEANATTEVTAAELLRGVLIQTDFYQRSDLSHLVRGHLYVWVTATRVTD